MRRTAAAILFAFLLAPTPVLADGATIDFQREFVEPGGLAEAVTYIWLGRKDVAKLDEGPFHAYLLPANTWIDPPRIPPSAIPIGEINFAQTGPREGTASLSFVVPDVEPASYGIYYCNDPCKIAVVGDLTGGWIRIAGSEAESQLLSEREHLERKASTLERRLNGAEQESARLAEEAQAAPGTPGMLGEGELVVSRPPGDGRFDGTSLVLVALGGLALGLLLGRRRSRVRRRPFPRTATPVEEAEHILEQVPTGTSADPLSLREVLR